MSVVLRKMTDDEFKTLYKEGIEHYTQGLMEERNFIYENAKLQAIKEFSDILPNGLQTENNLPMAIAEKNSGETVGFICVLHKGENEN